MPRDLFGSAGTPVAITRAFSRYTVVGSLALHLVIIAVVLIVPLFADDVLPRVDMGRTQYVTPLVTTTPPPVAASQPVRPQLVNRNAAPIVAPTQIREEQPQPPAADASPYSLVIADAVSGIPSGGGLIGEGMSPAPPPPPVHEQPRPVGPQRVGGGIRQPVRTHYVAPIYPTIAQQARIEGPVQIDAIIGIDGVVQQARVLSGSPLLSDAAISAVRQWRYTPTMLNNQPVAVIMTVTVTFTLQH